jgi:hydroxyacylglutathione hydrolase
MLFRRIESKGLAHYSYLIGDKTEAVVIDPRRDCDAYIQTASDQGMRITHILETHRNEDYVVGSRELAARTEAEIWHADTQLTYQYGQPVEDDKTWKIGRLKLKTIHTPGHTPGSMSYLLYDYMGKPWMIFTGDALFAGDVGRVDLPGVDMMKEMAGLLYDSLFKKILPLGDEIIVCPGHGAGSVCGAAIAERVWTTVGIERKHNPKLQHTDKDAFVKHIAQEIERPPYFRQMEKLNIMGAPLLGALPLPPPLSPSMFEAKMGDAIVLDTRMELGFSAAHVPGSLSIWINGLPSFAGWFLPYDKPLLLVNETDNPDQVMRYLIRVGYDNLAGYLSGGMLSWHVTGRESHSIRTITVQELCHELDTRQKPWILDVRSDDEVRNDGKIPDSHHIHITQLPNHIDQVPKDSAIRIFCGSGLRSMTAASLLQKRGWQEIIVILGGLSGWNSISCPLE